MSKNFHAANKELKPSFVSPPIAGVLSLIIPGLGHVLARAFQRGVLLFLSMASIIGLLIMRINITARRETELIATAKKAFSLQPLLLTIAIAVILLYLWIAYDAYGFAKRTARAGLGPFLLVILILFGLGWQVGQIDPVYFIREVGKAKYRLQQILWPWDNAITHDTEAMEGIQEIHIPCSDNPPPPSERTPSQPFLIATPTCGVLSEQEGATGTPLTLIGGNFKPNTETEILWQDPIGNEFRQRQGGEYIQVVTDDDGAFQIDIIMPYRLIPPSSTAEGTLSWRVLARQTAAVGPAKPSVPLLLSIDKMIETIFLGMMATFFGIILALPISFLAAKNLMSSSIFTLAIYFLTRTVLNIIRSVEPLIWAVIAVTVVGLGPFAGIVALTLHSIAALAKLYSEAIESINPGPIEAIQATGANWLQTVIYGVVPQIIPPFISFTIYRWDINVRMSTVIGLVGGGGIGFLLVQWMRLLDFKSAGIAVWFIVITVAVLDFVSSDIRERFV